MQEWFKKLPTEIISVSIVCFILGLAMLLGAYHLTPEPMKVIAHSQTLPIPMPDPVFKFILKEIGFALIVAAVLASSIDYITRKKHEDAADRLVERMNQRLFHTVLGRDIPASLYAYIKEDALNIDFFRTDFRVFFVLGSASIDSENPDASNYIRVSEQTQFTVKNISGSSRNYLISLALDPSKFPPEEKVPNTKFDFVKVNGQDIQFTSGPTMATSREINACYEIALSPNEEAIIDSASTTYMRLVDEQAYSMRHATEGARITVVSHSPNLDIQAYANHPHKLITVRTDSTLKEWRQESAMLAGQGFTVKWCGA